MKIPPDAMISPEKLRRYLLVPLARNDKSGFLARAGFTLANPSELEAAIRTLCNSVDAIEDGTHQYGTDYIVTGELVGPNGVALRVVLVWVQRSDGEFRFVTLKPPRRKALP